MKIKQHVVTLWWSTVDHIKNANNSRSSFDFCFILFTGTCNVILYYVNIVKPKYK